MRLQSILLPAGDPICEASDSADRGMFFRVSGGELIADGGEVKEYYGYLGMDKARARGAVKSTKLKMKDIFLLLTGSTNKKEV